jgi:hypothetical protein
LNAHQDGASQGTATQDNATQDNAGQDSARTGAVASLGGAAIITAIALIAVYIAMLGFLMTLRADKEWDRLVYLLSGFEALVFAGAGALFGSTIQRANVAAARSDAADAREAAKTERDRAQSAEEDATAGRMLAATIKAKAEARADGSGRIRGSRPEPRQEAGAGLAGLDSDLQELAMIARTIMPDA